MMRYLALAAILLLTACSKVPSGNVGVKVYLLGGEKGVDTEILGPGRYWIGMNEDLFLFPTFTQNYTWQSDEAISFQSVEGLNLTAEVGISYSIEPSKVPLVFQKYRKGVDEITDIYLRNMVRDALVSRSSDQPIDALYGKGKADLMAEVEQAVREQVSGIGINVERIYWIGNIGLPQQVVASINKKIEATQIALQRENEVKTAEAQAQIEVAKARGDADSTLLRARAEAESIRIKAEALSQNAKLVELNAVERWDGKLPVNLYGSAPMPFINLSGK